MSESTDRALLSQALYAVATGSPTAVKCTLQTADRIGDSDLAKHVRDSAEYSRKFGEWFAVFNADYGVEAGDEPNLILQTQLNVAMRMMDEAPDAEAADMAAIDSLRTALGYWGPLVSTIKLHAEKLGRADIVEVADKGIKAVNEADEAAVQIIIKM
ncbi:hypothetical protein [Sphingomonas sp. CLY1604]|uniref:hypothetical protein n=1 Tax=Sphingomonas sp. CLY1604 TaxID=3457786 RepID=UPI003FD8233A